MQLLKDFFPPEGVTGYIRNMELLDIQMKLTIADLGRHDKVFHKNLHHEFVVTLVTDIVLKSLC